MVSQPRVGICIFRVEQQEDYLLITVTVNHYLSPTLSATRPDVTERYTDPAEAVKAARRFLEVFQ